MTLRVVLPVLATLFTMALSASPSSADWRPPFGNPVCVAPCDQVVISSISDGGGGMYLAWDDNRICGNKISYVQHLDNHGAVVAGWPALGRPVCNNTVGQVTPLLVSDAQGGAIAVWKDYRTGSTIYAARFAPNGTPLWDPAGVAVCDAGAPQDGPSVLADGAGGVIVTWMDNRLGLHRGPPSHDPLFTDYAQHLLANGVRAWSALGAPISSDVVYQPPTVLSTSATGTLITWHGSSFKMQRLDASGAPLLGADGVAVPGMETYIVVSDGAGGAIGVYGHNTPGVTNLFAQRADASGALLWGAADSKPVSEATDLQQVNDVCPDGSGGVYITWNDLRSGDDRDVFVQHLNATGDPVAGWPANGLDLTPVPGLQLYPRVVADGNQGCIVTWQDARITGSTFDIFAQRVTAGGGLASGWAGSGVAVCTAAGDQNFPVITTDGGGNALIAWQDWRADGDVYAQRVRADGLLGEDPPVTGVEPTMSAAFAIAGVFPNPGRASAVLSVSFSLPNDAPAWLALFDAQGRLVTRQMVQAAGGGRSTVLVDGSALAPGMYVLRLQQFGRSAARSLAIVK